MKYKFTLDRNVNVQTSIKGMDVNHPFFILEKSGLLRIKNNYSWDGMTCYPDDDTTYYASLYHDCLYQIIRLKLINYKYKVEADKLLYHTLINDGHSKIMSALVYIVVSIFGKFFL